MGSFLATTAYLTPVEGWLARLRLADQGIESRLESLDLVTWMWHLSLAFQGVKLVVRSDDALRAAEILANGRHETTEPLMPRQCSGCDESLPSDWHVCWRCGTDVAAGRDESFFTETIRPTQIASFAQEVECLWIWLILVTVLISIVPAMAFAFLLLIFVLTFRSPTPMVKSNFIPEEFAASPDHSLTADFSIDTNRRALASAMFGLVWFPPLTLYSIWILLNHDDETDCAQIRLWRRAAWTFNFVGLLAVMSCFGLFLKSLNGWDVSWWISQFFVEYFETSRGFAG